MAKFVMKELLARSTIYKGVSGIAYKIYKNVPFEVKEEMDIKYFKSKKQFEEVGLFKAHKKPKPEKNIEEQLEDELTQIKGISKKIVKKIVEIYVSKDKLMQVLESNSNLGPEFPKKTQNILIAHYLKK